MHMLKTFSFGEMNKGERGELPHPNPSPRGGGGFIGGDCAASTAKGAVAPLNPAFLGGCAPFPRFWAYYALCILKEKRAECHTLL